MSTNETRRWAVRVELVEVLDEHGSVAAQPEQMIWFITAGTRDEAFDRAMKYFIEGADKSALTQ